MDFAIINNGVVGNVIVADQDFVDEHYPGAVRVDNLTPTPGIGWLYANGEFSPKPLEPAPPPISIFTKFGFRNRFTIEELVACDNAVYNMELTSEQRAVLNTVMKSFDAAQEVDLTNQATIFGVNYLAQAGLLTPERATEILTP